MAEKKPTRRAPAARTGARARGWKLPGLAWAFRFHTDGTVKELEPDQPIAPQRNGWLWLHFNQTDPSVPQSLAKIADLPQSARASLVARDDRQQLQADQACVYGVFPNTVRKGKGLDLGFVHFAMTQRMLVSLRHEKGNAKDTIREAVKKTHKITNVAMLFEAIVQHVVDAVDDYAEELAQRLDNIEERILSNEESDERLTLGRIRRTTVQLHRQLGMLQALIRRFKREDLLPFTRMLKLTTERLDHRLSWLDTEIVALRDRSHLLQEEVTLKLAERTNRHLEVLSIVATVFLPASLVAGVFGMNVSGLPLTQTPYGFAVSVLLIFAISALVFWLLRRSGVVGGDK
jgi:zinc transporter